MLAEHTLVALQTDLPAYRLQTGDTGTIVSVHPASQSYTVEFMTLGGDTLALPTLPQRQVRPVSLDEIPQARPLTAIA